MLVRNMIACSRLKNWYLAPFGAKGFQANSGWSVFFCFSMYQPMNNASIDKGMAMTSESTTVQEVPAKSEPNRALQMPSG